LNPVDTAKETKKKASKNKNAEIEAMSEQIETLLENFEELKVQVTKTEEGLTSID